MTKHNVLSDQEKQEGWQLLFDGQNPNQYWRGYQQENLPDGWQVDGGALHRADKGGDIVTRDIFKDVEIVMDWKIQGVGNSGIFFRVGEGEEQIFHTGPEYQIINNAHSTADNTIAGSNYALHAPTRDATKPVGEWNSARLRIQGNQVAHWLNGEKIVTYELGSVDWKKRVSESKFNQWPSYGQLSEGHIALQDHGDPVWFRNMKVRKL